MLYRNAKLHFYFELVKIILDFFIGWWVGKAEKWRSPFLGVGLAVRCKRSEHGKSQLSKKYLCTISYHFFSLICQTAQNFQPYFLQVRTVARLPAHYIQRPAGFAKLRGEAKSASSAISQNQQMYEVPQGEYICW
jgi:hypothetical protein